MSICGAIIRGTLWGNNKMKLTVEDIALDNNDMQSAGKGIVVKLDNGAMRLTPPTTRCRRRTSGL